MRSNKFFRKPKDRKNKDNCFVGLDELERIVKEYFEKQGKIILDISNDYIYDHYGADGADGIGIKEFNGFNVAFKK